MTKQLKLHNSLSGKKELFQPLDESNIRMYVCGPTVYDRPHIGNARSVVVYDVLFRLLRQVYGEVAVTYVRNITDVDDKINKAAKENAEPISELTARITEYFHDDMAALGCLPPTHEPRATQHIDDIINLIQSIKNNSHAYESKGHILFNVGSIEGWGDYNYGKLSGRKLEDLIAGARVDVEDYKNNPADFVLWKPANEGDDESSVFDSPWGKGRPGWHIECSAMSMKYLSETFDIHGGGADLKFPHHENEIIQSRCGHESAEYAKYWVHNGFVTVEGEKMAKSLGNFTTVRELLDEGINGEVIRLMFLSTHYRKPLDFSQAALDDAKKKLNVFYEALRSIDNPPPESKIPTPPQGGSKGLAEGFWHAIADDMNVSLALTELYKAAKSITKNEADNKAKQQFVEGSKLLGLLTVTPDEWFGRKSDVDAEYIEAKIAARNAAKQQKNFTESDRIRDELEGQGILLEDSREGTSWRKI